MIIKLNTFILLLSALPHILHGITTIHHDKPEQSRISEMATTMTQTRKLVPSTQTAERQNRLLPYVNYYLSHNQQKTGHGKFTPFLESNALPGPFIPIVRTTPPSVEMEYAPPTENSPNYAEIYDKLAQLKQAQLAMRHHYNTIYQKPVHYIPIHYYHEPFRNVPPMKTIIETYTPTNIDIDIDKDRKKSQYVSEADYKISSHKKPVSHPYAIERPLYTYKTQTMKQYEKLSEEPIVVLEEKQPEYTQTTQPPIYNVATTPKPQVNTIVEENFIAQKLVPVDTTEPPEYPKQYAPVQFTTQKPIYTVQEYYSSPAPNIPTEKSNILSKLLKQLQVSNTLPQTFTLQNIDNSIRTLVKILNGLRKQQKIKTKPIIVNEEDLETNLNEGEVTEKPIPEIPEYPPGTSTQVFPANTIDGGTPGRPGIDYPALSSIPQTDFNCKKQRYKGFFGDPHTNCQVWHYCDLNGGQASFLCPNGTIFSQVALTCDWWYNVKCSSTPQLYVLNERLYKYIIPLTPKFPEDYTGPLVDRYLALKFQEMEEKMKQEKKKKDEDESEEEKDDSDQLQDIRNKKSTSEKT